jgi:hypothetical protein
MCIGEPLGDILENEAEDGMVGNLAAEGVPGGENVVALRLAGLGSDKHGVGGLGENKSIGENG